MSGKKKKKISKFKAVVLGILILLPFSLIAVFSFPSETTFSVTVHTELLEYQTTDRDNSKIKLQNFQMYNYDTDSLGLFDGMFKVAKGAQVKVERVAMGGLSIIFQNKDDLSAGDFYSKFNETKTHSAGSYIEFYCEDIEQRINNGETIIIPISGNVILGRNVNYETYSASPALLRDGNIVVIGKSIFGNSYYKSNSYALNIGEEFRVDEPLSEAYGFVTINENPGMTAAYKIAGKKGRILTPGPQDENSGYPLTLSFISRIQNDLFFKVISLLLTILIIIATIIPFFSDYYQKFRK